MKSRNLLILTAGIVALMLSGCAQYNTSRILSQDDAQVAITLNKDYKTSIISVNDGARIEPCIDPDVRQQEKTEPTSAKICGPLGQGKILREETYKLTVREGSVCISIWAGNHRYDFCDPPYHLQF